MGDHHTQAEAAKAQVDTINTEVALQQASIDSHILHPIEWAKQHAENISKELAKLNK
jgi:hypothetical protein